MNSNGPRDNHIYERLYELLELMIWILFRRRDRPIIQAEITRLFRGELGSQVHVMRMESMSKTQGTQPITTKKKKDKPISGE